MSRRKKSKLLLVVALAALLFSGFFLFRHRHNFIFPQSQDYLGETKGTKASSKIWRPKEAQNFQNPSLEVDATAALSCDFSSGEIFFAKNIHQRLPSASLTKIMTAMTVLDHASVEQVLEVSPEIEDLPADSSYMGISRGEKYTVKDLLYGLLLPSGNDAALTLADGVSGHNHERFVYWMNKKAKVLGLSNTHFSNPSGLDEEENYSSVYDLAILSHYAVTHYPLIQEVVADRAHEIIYTEDHKYLFFGNFNDLMLIYEGVDGIKPGNTEEAGSCLVATATREEKRVMSIVLGSAARNIPTVKLLDLGFRKLGVLKD